MKYINIDISKEKELEQIGDNFKNLDEATESTTMDIKNVEDRDPWNTIQICRRMPDV